METFFTADTHWSHYNIVLHCNRTPWIYSNPDYDSSKPYHFKHNNPKAVRLKSHDEALIENWNTVVGKKDRIYILGDFAYKDHRKFIEALNGNKVLIKGNHDKMSHDCYKLFKEFDPVNAGVFDNIQKQTSSLLKRFKNGDIDLNECRKSIMSSMWSKFIEMQEFEDIDQMSNECYNKFEGVHEMGLRRRINNQDITLCHYAMRSWASSCHGSYHVFGHSHGRMPEFDNMYSFDVGVDIWDYTPVPWEAVELKMLRIKENIEEVKDRCVDGEYAARGLYSKDPEERVIETRNKNLQILRDIGATVKYAF